MFKRRSKPDHTADQLTAANEMLLATINGFVILVSVVQEGNQLTMTFRKGDEIIQVTSFATWDTDTRRLREVLNDG